MHSYYIGVSKRLSTHVWICTRTGGVSINVNTAAFRKTGCFKTNLIRT
jgi:hypothetical protein